MIAHIQVKRGDGVILQKRLPVGPPILDYLFIGIGNNFMEWATPAHGDAILDAQELKIEIDFIEPNESAKA